MNNLFLLKRSLHTTAFKSRGAVAHPGWYPRDHMPGNYPKTEEERRAAAIRYGLRPEDYTPFPSDDVVNHVGDYPDFGIVTHMHRDPYDYYTDRHQRRNWNEPVLRQAIRYRVDRHTYNGLDEEHFEPLAVVSRFASLLVPLAVIYFLAFHQGETFGKLRDYYMPRWYNGKLIKQYPYDYLRAFPWHDPRDYPILNYSFEPAEEGQNNIEEDNQRYPFNETER